MSPGGFACLSGLGPAGGLPKLTHLLRGMAPSRMGGDQGQEETARRNGFRSRAVTPTVPLILVMRLRGGLVTATQGLGQSLA